MRRFETERSALGPSAYLPRLVHVVLALALFSAACSQVAPTASGPTQPAAAATASAGFETQWNQLIEAARAEGKLVVSGPPTPETRKLLPEKFRERFGLELEYFAPGSTTDLLNRMEAERSSGLYTVDVIMGGAQSLYSQAYDDKLLDPVKPLLFHPEVTDGSKWVDGHVWFMDPEQQYILRLSNYLTNHIVVNTDYIKADEIKNWRDLLDPRYRGKMSVYEPVIAGTGWNTANYLWQKLGDDFMKSLYAGQQPAVSRDFRQLSDWTARGTYPISLGLRESEINLLQSQGFPVVVPPPPADLPAAVTAGFGLGVLVNKAPHPNSAKLFLNWIATREGQETWHRGERTVSIRTDVDNSWASAYTVPTRGVQFFDTYGWDYTRSSRNPAELERLKQLIATS
jgi:iron(III) transport system substrate-binding protein